MIGMCVAFTLNNCLYSTTPAHPASVVILDKREIRDVVVDCETEKTENIEKFAGERNRHLTHSQHYCRCRIECLLCAAGSTLGAAQARGPITLFCALC